MNLPSQDSPWHHSILLIPFWPSQIPGKPWWLSKEPISSGTVRVPLAWPPPGSQHRQFLLVLPQWTQQPGSNHSQALGMAMIPILSSWGMHSKIAVAFSPDSLTFHLYLICYLLSLPESFLHCCPPSCSPVFYFCLLFLFSCPLREMPSIYPLSDTNPWI